MHVSVALDAADACMFLLYWVLQMHACFSCIGCIRYVCIHACWFLQPLLPTPCTSEDAQQILHGKYQCDSSLQLFLHYIATSKLVLLCRDFFLPLIKEKAIKVRISCAYYTQYADM